MDLKRPVDPTWHEGIKQEVFYPVTMVRIDWPDEVVEVHTGAGDISFDGGTFLGTMINGEHFGTISVPPEASGLVATEITLTLYGPYEELLLRLNPAAVGRKVEVWLGITTEAGGNVLIGEPERVFVGSISGDALPAPTSGQMTALMIMAKSGSHGRVKGAITHSNEDQQSRYPNDTGFERNARASAYRAAHPKW